MNPTMNDSNQLPRTGLELSVLAAFVSALWLASPSVYAAAPPADATCDGCPSAPDESSENGSEPEEGAQPAAVVSEDTTTPELFFALGATGSGGSGEGDPGGVPLGPSLTIGLILGAAGLLGGLFHFLRERWASGAPLTSESPTARVAKGALSGLQGLVGALAALLLLVLTRSPVPECAGTHAPIDMLLLFGLGLLGAIGSKCLLGGMACNGQLPETARNAERRFNDVAERLDAALGNLRLPERDTAVMRAIARNGSRSMRSLADIVRDDALSPIIDGMGDVTTDVRTLIDGLVARGLVAYHAPSTPGGVPLYSPTAFGLETYMAAERTESMSAGQPIRGTTNTSISTSSPSGGRPRGR